MEKSRRKIWLALALLCVPMFASYFFDDMFSTLSQLFQHPECLELGWDSADYGFYAGGYSFLCVCGGLIVCGILLDVFGVRIVGSVFVALMTIGALMVYGALVSGMAPGKSLALAYAGCMIFGLGSEIAGVAVTRSIAKWFKGGKVAFAMGLQVAVARLGTASAFIISPMLVAQKAAGGTYSLWETSKPALFGLALLMLGTVAWGIFIAMDRMHDRENGIVSGRGAQKEEDKFQWSDILKVIGNPRFILISLLCVFFYCCIISFKKFGTAIVIPRFGLEADGAKWMITMIPFFTVVFTPLFGALVDRTGKATLWMLGGSALVLGAHLVLAFAPQGVPAWGYAGIAMLGTGYSLVPSAMWPSVPRIIPEKNLGTAYSLIYWIQNMGMLLVPIFVGRIFNAYSGVDAASRAEYVFIGLGIVACIVATLLRNSSSRHPELGIDVASKK
ncbi:MAG: MFS transporter [Bacteroidales bacterium]|nr:MFS transporter [Bacteroidales bacterium]